MKMKELQQKTKDELQKLLKEERHALRDFRFQTSQGKAKNNKKGREMKKNIARILTRFHSLKS